jgi:hypothetical protein
LRILILNWHRPERREEEEEEEEGWGEKTFLC